MIRRGSPHLGLRASSSHHPTPPDNLSFPTQSYKQAVNDGGKKKKNRLNAQVIFYECILKIKQRDVKHVKMSPSVFSTNECHSHWRESYL